MHILNQRIGFISTSTLRYLLKDVHKAVTFLITITVFIQNNQISSQNYEQESIPVGCVPTAFRSYPIVSMSRRVPGTRDTRSERTWGQRYLLTLVNRQTLVKILPPRSFVGWRKHLQSFSCLFADEPSAVKEEVRHLQLYAQVFDYISRGVTERSVLSRMLFILEILHKSLDVSDSGVETIKRWILKRFESVSVSVSVTAFSWSRKVFQDHSKNVNIKADWMVSKTCRDHPNWSLQVFQNHPVVFLNIYISWNGLKKSFKTIQNLMLMHKLMRIHSAFIPAWKDRLSI